MRPWLTQKDWEAVLEEVRRTIDRWFFWVSVTGVIYVTPKNRSLELNDLADMISRLAIICDEDFPKLIAFEFSDTSLEAKDSDEATSMLQQFATNIQASILPIYRNWSGMLILLHRDIDGADANAEAMVAAGTVAQVRGQTLALP